MNDSPFDFEALLSPFLPEGARAVAVAVSGGADSMALCYVLSRCAEKMPLHILTVDHGLRPEAALEASQVAETVSNWPQACHVILKRELSPPQSPPQAGGKLTRIQEDARHDRYKLMADYCAKNDIERLFVAHHLDDQAETFLFRLAKGSGLDGLGGMRSIYDYSENLKIVRPFLDVPKSELVDFCKAQDVPYINDPSNDDARFARVRLRKSYEVLAKEGLTSKRLSVTANRLARARVALDCYTENTLGQALLINEPDRVVFRFDVVKAAPEEIRLRVLAKVMGMVRKKKKQDYGPRMERLENLSVRLFSSDPDFKRVSLGGCLIGLNQKNWQVTVEREKNNAS